MEKLELAYVHPSKTKENNMTSDQIYKAYCDQLIQIENLQKEIARLQERNEKLSKRHPTKEKALAQYEWLKANSKRNKETE